MFRLSPCASRLSPFGFFSPMAYEVRVFREGCRYMIDVQRGDIISLFPLSCRRCRAVTRGLRWPLDSLEWRPGDMGISNEAVEDVVEVMVVEGRYLWVRNLAPV